MKPPAAHTKPSTSIDSVATGLNATEFRSLSIASAYEDATTPSRLGCRRQGGCVTIRHESVPWVYSTSAGHVKILFHFIKPTPETDSRGILTHDLMVIGSDLGKSTRETRYCCIKLCEDASPAATAPHQSKNCSTPMRYTRCEVLLGTLFT
jgi:hypothetical protein